MPSLTPETRKDEVSTEAMKEGAINGVLALIPTMGAVFAGIKFSPKFRQVTNVQSRTAICIMPALFAFALTSEEKVLHSMREMAKENQHAHDSVHWAERRMTARKDCLEQVQQQQELSNLYRRAVYESGVRVIPGDELSTHHIAANYVQENPFKVLASLAVPGAAWIFYGRSGQEHLTFSMKVMHTRVFGQFATISMLLGIMGFKEMMDKQGRYITEAQAEARVDEMKEVRNQMMRRLEATNSAKQAYTDAIQEAHDQDVQEGHTSSTQHHNNSKKAHHNKKKAAAKLVEDVEEQTAQPIAAST